MNTVAVVGGGASGMMAALKAAEDHNNKVLLFERQSRVGRKLLATGNGRCNLTNAGASAENYHGADPTFASFALSSFPPAAALAFFRGLGLVCTEQYGGRVYPLSDAAGSVLDVLRFALDSAGVELHPAETVTALQRCKDSFAVQTDLAVYHPEYVVIACGGKAGGKLGGVSDGYDLLRSLGHRCTKLYPSLVPLRTDTDYPRSLKGVRADASVKLCSGTSVLAESCGEVQFVEKGVSGPAVFDVSREASVHGGELLLDFMRGFSAPEIQQLLLQRRSLSPELENANVFAGLLHSRLGLVLVKYAGLKPSDKIGSLSAKDIARLAEAAKAFRLRVTGTDSFDTAQVTAGGISVDDFNPRTLESKLAPGLFACGEVLDIDGDCGGYNLQWAWASGALAGRLGK